MANNNNWSASFLDELSKSAAWWPGKLLGRKNPKTGLNRKETKAKEKADADEKADTAKAKKNLKSNVKKRDAGRKAKDYKSTAEAQNRINKAKGSKVRHTESSAKAQHKEQKAYSSAQKAYKTNKSKSTLSQDIAARKKHKKGTKEYAAIQNRINAAYGSKKRHKADDKVSIKKNDKKNAIVKKSSLKFFGNVG